MVPVLFSHLTNSRYRSGDEGADYERPEDALASGVRGALALLSDEIHDGEPNAAIDVSVSVRVSGADGTPLLRAVAAVSVSTLQPN